jgi:hypothetical protein
VSAATAAGGAHPEPLGGQQRIRPGPRRWSPDPTRVGRPGPAHRGRGPARRIRHPRRSWRRSPPGAGRCRQLVRRAPAVSWPAQLHRGRGALRAVRRVRGRSPTSSAGRGQSASPEAAQVLSSWSSSASIETVGSGAVVGTVLDWAVGAVGALVVAAPPVARGGARAGRRSRAARWSTGPVPRTPPGRSWVPGWRSSRSPSPHRRGLPGEGDRR